MALFSACRFGARFIDSCVMPCSTVWQEEGDEAMVTLEAKEVSGLSGAGAAVQGVGCQFSQWCTISDLSSSFASFMRNSDEVSGVHHTAL